ncbi:hypothetical protein [Microcoleus sp. PH2017_05_CCC_O_A]|uniref:hypothetical protein n=1 Tax=Microcoleus sp. PH2017_05_CCC_O_A TaxID=2798816 RepID=UPI001D3B7A26|nr:hypothetical protein [Microcoleus sp. PH2017_05_CCC_O_A]MCC3438982.1 hypothetical protein [Microcoleus sp. PH2017_05_CCC_O_A]
MLLKVRRISSKMGVMINSDRAFSLLILEAKSKVSSRVCLRRSEGAIGVIWLNKWGMSSTVRSRVETAWSIVLKSL